MDGRSHFYRRIELESMLRMCSRVAAICIALLLWIAALDQAQVVLAPLSLGIIMGLMVLPAAQFLERSGISPWLSAGVAVILFLLLIMATLTAFALPISTWVDQAPQIWQALQLRLNDWRATIESVNEVVAQVSKGVGTADGMRVTVDENSGVETVITLAPQYAAQILLFLVSLYFFLATRESFRATVLTLCVTRPLRWRTARIFRDVEQLMSRYLFVISIINLGLGLCVALVMWLINMPTPLLWGMLAAFLNYAVYVGPALMTLILTLISLATHQNLFDTLLPPALYLGLNFIESQLVTPRLLGSTATINPFLIFLSLTFWLWLWGPIGGFIAVPSLLILSAILRNIIPHLALSMREDLS
ncbi:AI-2E family transporter [Rhizobium sp. L1K21]|uniref:AI-2E family transporter n=1 Tax=Rhizobium sp. L1K21 TaxID=2954933 RepID=UPI002093A643|nr:AI-2E family transporter [Rhizobium sp. L1K21]MCO6184672.1 AI-2E family transporter [Rhizobium sp. L1K21]